MGFGDFGSRYELGSSFFHAGVRGAIGVLPVSELAIRVGGEVGLEVIDPGSHVRAYGGPLVEIAGRLLDQENLEIAVQLEMQSRGWSRSEDNSEDGTHGTAVGGAFWTPRFGIGVAYVF